jgi:hypothetical protein
MVNRSTQASARRRIVCVIFHDKNMVFSGQDASSIADM